MRKRGGIRIESKPYDYKKKPILQGTYKRPEPAKKKSYIPVNEECIKCKFYTITGSCKGKTDRKQGCLAFKDWRNKGEKNHG